MRKDSAKTIQISGVILQQSYCTLPFPLVVLITKCKLSDEQGRPGQAFVWFKTIERTCLNYRHTLWCLIFTKFQTIVCSFPISSQIFWNLLHLNIFLMAIHRTTVYNCRELFIYKHTLRQGGRTSENGSLINIGQCRDHEQYHGAW